MSRNDLTPKKRTGELSRLVAEQRQRLAGWTPERETVNTSTEDGEDIKEKTVAGPAGTTKTVNVNLSHLFHPAVSTTGDVSILLIEAELVADGKDLGNPHIPSTESVLERATERIEAEGLTPAWKVV